MPYPMTAKTLAEFSEPIVRYCPCNGECHGAESPCSFDCAGHHHEIIVGLLRILTG